MLRRILLMMVVLTLASLPSIACDSLGATPEAAQAATSGPASIEPIEGTELHRLTLSAKTAERMAIKTVRVREVQVAQSGSTATRKVVPYASVLYGLKNDAWVYTSRQPLVYVRHRIAIDYIEGDNAVLLEGPAVDTEVVTAGAAELLGTEFETRR
jgi:hypothetical protein